MRNNPFDLGGRVAVVTGARRGIGKGIAVALAHAGADIIGVSRHGAQDETRVAVEQAGAAFTSITADLSTMEGVSVVTAALTMHGRPIDILVNNAGIAQRAPAESHSDDQWNEVIAVNLSAPFALTRAVSRDMLDRGSGKVIFLASMMTFQGGMNVASYAASKAGVAGLTRALANEWAGRGVNVNAIAPGYIETDLTVASHQDDDRRQAFQSRIPAERWGQPADLGGAAVFLSSAASDYVHGVVLPVDGGWLVR